MVLVRSHEHLVAKLSGNVDARVNIDEVESRRPVIAIKVTSATIIINKGQLFSADNDAQ